LVFVHIPKNAGQAVTGSFGCPHQSTDHSLNSAEDRTFMGGQYVRFAVVRNPVNRFFSAYKYQCHMKKINTDKVPLRKMIIEKGLDRNINEFVDRIIENRFDLQSDMWFRRQVFWLRSSSPQILLRFENLKEDINIVRALAPQYFKGLEAINTSRGRDKSDNSDFILNRNSLSYIENFYERDFFYLSYDPALRQAL